MAEEEPAVGSGQLRDSEALLQTQLDHNGEPVGTADQSGHQSVDNAVARRLRDLSQSAQVWDVLLIADGYGPRVASFA